MKRFSIFPAVCVALLMAGCGRGGSNTQSQYPDNFNAIGDTARVGYMIRTVSPDSVARFICRAALGQLEGTRIDSLGIATNYAYEQYIGKDADLFGSEYDNFVNSLPLADKMRMYAMAGVEDPQGLGLQLGLEYMQSIREKNMSVSDVEKELEEFRKACGDDKDTYNRFIIGFRTVLEADSGRDMPKEIYDRFINLR